ncbi:MAG: hypothetical protein N2486_06195 [Caloramator sp.]|nr:hypothetical protein [Caloramator sp.]
MKRNVIYLQSFLDNIEKRCLNIIDENIENYFLNIFKAALAYATLVSKDFKSHNKTNFENMVISDKEIFELINSINKKLLNEIESNFSIILNKEDNFSPNIKVDSLCIDNLVERLSITYEITKKAQNLIDSNISNIISLWTKNPVSSYIVGKLDFGKILLGKNSVDNLTQYNRERIYNTIKGLIENLKTELRIQLINNTLNILNEIYEDMDYKEDIA